MLPHKTNKTALTSSKWLSTFITDKQSNHNFFKRLLENLRNAEMPANSMERFYDNPSKQDYHKIMQELNVEITFFKLTEKI